MGAWWVTARALPEKVESRNKVQIPPSSLRTTQLYRCGAYCRTSAVLPLWIGRYVLLHCCCKAVVVDWSVDEWWVVGA